MRLYRRRRPQPVAAPTRYARLKMPPTHYARPAALAFLLLAAACQRMAPLNTPVTTTLRPAPIVEPDPPITPGVSEELARARRASIRGVAYNLALVIPAEKTAPIEVEEQVSFNLQDNRHPIQLDFKAPTEYLHSLTLNGQPIRIDHHDEHLVLPAAALLLGHNVVQLRLRAGELSLNRNADYLYTLLVPDRARTVLPVFDQPDLKATFTLALIIPQDWSAVANALQDQPVFADSVSARAGTKTCTFATSDSISTYLFSFAAGKFTTVFHRPLLGPPMDFLHRETDPTKLRLSIAPIFRLHADALAFMEAYTGLPYPFQKFDFVAIPDFQYGGMEHVGAIDYKASSLFLDEGATQDQVLARASLIAHETAHMWFGDLVTMRWFDDVWMKEVFANFMADKMVTDSGGIAVPDWEGNYWLGKPLDELPAPNQRQLLKFVIDHYPAAYGIDRTAGANPIRQPLANLQNAGSLYGNIIYHKAPIMMRQLERLMGPEAFRDGLREYLKTYAHGNATWPELIAILDARTPTDLQAWNQVWVNQPGRPVFSYRSDHREGMFRMVITQRAEDGSNRLWPQEFEVLLVYADGHAQEKTVKMTGADAWLDVLGSYPTSIIFNYTGIGYGVFPTSAAQAALLPGLRSPVARAAAYVNLYENMLNGQALSPTQLLGFVRRTLGREPEELNLKLLTGQASAVFWQFLTPAQRRAMGPGLEADLWAALLKSPAPNAKKQLFKTYQSVALTPAAQRRLYQIWRTQKPPAGLKLTEDDYTALALALAVRDYPAPILPAQLACISNPDRRQRLQYLMPALSAEVATRDAFFESLHTKTGRAKEAWVTVALGYLHHPLRQATSEKYLPTSLDLLQEIQLTGDIFFPYSWLQATLGSYQSATAAATVRAFLAAHPDYNPPLRAKLLQASDDLFRAEKLAR